VRWIEKRVGGRWAAATSVQAGAVLVAFVIASTVGVAGSAVRLTLIGLLALAMGGQNAVVRRLAVPHYHCAHLDHHRPGRRHHTPISARPATDLGPGDARGCANGRWLVALGCPRRAALIGGSTAGRLCCGRLPGDRPPTLAHLAIAPMASPASKRRASTGRLF
jgi:hypothetical protein